MNIFSLPKNRTLIRAIAIFVLSAILCLRSFQLAQADGAPPPDPTVGGVGPYQPQKTNVQMMSETVLIEVPPSPINLETPKQIKVNASFTMQNQGEKEEQMQVIFPLTRLGYGGSMEQALYKVDKSSFIAKVDGRTVPISEISTPPEIVSTDMEHGFPEDVQWAAFPATFPVKQSVILQVEYEMLNEYGEYGEGFTGIAYILETGAGWYGNILSADITLHLPYPITEEAIKSANPGYIISGNEMHWKLKEFEPARQDNLEVRVIHADVWQEILELRAQVEKSPKDANLWSELGDQYMRQAILMRESIFMAFNPHFIELTIEARQNVVNLLPDSADAHYQLAEILWLGHPGVQSALRQGGPPTAPNPTLDDPTIQRIIQEMQIAHSLGLNHGLLFFGRVFPQLAISTNGIVTVTPTATLAVLATRTASPTIAPTISPSASPTPITVAIETPSSGNKLGNWVLAVIGLIITGGIYAYRQKVKLRDAD